MSTVFLDSDILASRPGVEMRVPFVDGHTLLAMGYYRSTGLQKGQIADFRRPLPDGRGIHVRLYQGYATAHWDRVDPSVSLIGHLLLDAPVQTAIGAIAIAGLLSASSS